MTNHAPNSTARRANARVFSTYDIARLTGAAPRTVAKWIDGGQLIGWRLPGTHSDRRVSRRNLVAFLKAASMTDALELLNGTGRPVLLVGCSAVLVQTLTGLLPEGMPMHAADCLPEAGALVERYRPAIVVLDAGSLGFEQSRALAWWLSTLEKPPRVVALLPEDGTSLGDRVKVDVLLRQPVSPAALVKAMEGE